MDERPRPQDAHPASGGDVAFTATDFRQIADLVHKEAGIVLGEDKTGFVYSRLAKRLQAAGMRNFRDYCALIQDENGIDERQTMIACLTASVTAFFREPHHFEHLKSELLPRLAAKARLGEKVRIWSAGCATGEEAYSIALTVLDAIPQAVESGVLILATDIDANALGQAREGIYTPSQIAPIPENIRSRWFAREARENQFLYRVSEHVREIVRFKELNLTAAWPLKGQFDAIFCRNVLMYFDEPGQQQILKGFAARMIEDGVLYIGTQDGISLRHSSFERIAQAVYRLQQGVKR